MGERRLRRQNLRWAVRAPPWWVSTVSFGAGLWLILRPAPYDAAMAACVLLPLFACGLRIWRPDEFTFAGEDTQAAFADDLSLLWVFPGLALGARTTADVGVLDTTQAAAATVIVAMAMIGALVALDQQMRRWLPAFIAIFCIGGWAWGLVNWLNIRLAEPPRVVLGYTIRKDTHKKGPDTLTIQLRDPQASRVSFGVASVRYRVTQVGQPVWLDLYEGRLGWRAVTLRASTTRP